MPGIDDEFYTRLPLFDAFARVADPDVYQALPGDWVVGFADVTGSTKQLQAGRYKAVNMAGAGVIAAVANALERRFFPYCFGGDGASFAVAPNDAQKAAQALRDMAVFASEELQIDLRIATLPVEVIRANGQDVRVARFAQSAHASYAMFSGGGLAWFEARVKQGEFRLTPAPSGNRPDLLGLSCRWTIAPAANGVVLSLILVPRGMPGKEFRLLVEEIVALADHSQMSAQPVTPASLRAKWPGNGVGLETAASVPQGKSRLAHRLKLLAETLLAAIILRLNLKAGNFDAQTYTNDVAANADFRKFDDGLKMTIDCTTTLADTLEARMQRGSSFAAYGTFRQTEALMTCFVPSIADRNHVHFVDGAGGGYALAAQAMKARLAGGAGLP